ncbi:hypothetical protein CDN99_24295 [Roseateles aquatilis]|uniref:Thioredoxin domain-containing protein n=1 Tax=Roseateles aquatilis TaxID=431061 RepID=A0A246IX91_9BURK|nr:TlpA disulfide reductase family protein [Roseateles aquatilis]OWQ84419.1 hypothetical protein CDN99_24295 [Roseateles aquatilis]
MSEVFALGPLVLPWAFLHLCAAVAVSLALAAWLARRGGQDNTPLLWRCLLVAVLFSRLGFIYQYKELYAADPLGLINIRDGGWSPDVGLIAMWLYATYRLRKLPALARPVGGPLLAGTLLFVVAQVSMGMRSIEGELPALSFETLDGDPVRLDALRGKPVVVNLWATWCGPCIREMPALQAAQQRRADVHFVFINQGESPERVAAWLRGQRLSLRNVALDEPRRAGAAFQQRAYPTTLFFDASGRLTGRRVGELSQAALEAGVARAAPGRAGLEGGSNAR